MVRHSGPGDEVYGGNPKLRTTVEERGTGYVRAVARTHEGTTQAGSSAQTPLPTSFPSGPGRTCPPGLVQRTSASTTGPTPTCTAGPIPTGRRSSVLGMVVSPLVVVADHPETAYDRVLDEDASWPLPWPVRGATP